METMALRYGDGIIEVACNLLDTDVTPPEIVEVRLPGLARADVHEDRNDTSALINAKV